MTELARCVSVSFMKLSYEVPEGATTITLAPGLELFSELLVRGEDYKGYDVEVLVVFEEGRLLPQRVCVHRRPGGPAVTGEALRSVAVAAFVRRSLGDASFPSMIESGTRVAFGLLDVQDRDRMREAGPITETLQAVARVYAAALAVGDKPTKVVAEAFEVPGYTAGRWVAGARKRGFLGPAEPGKASI